MMKNVLKYAVVIFSLASLPSLADAAEGGKVDPRRKPAARQSEKPQAAKKGEARPLMQKLRRAHDLDGNGRLDKLELAALKAHQQERIARRDLRSKKKETK